jgi:GTP-binding protein HflX
MSQLQREQLKVVAERAVLAGVDLPRAHVDPVDPFRELRALTETAGATVAGELRQRRRRPHPATCLGKGKVEELAALVAAVDGSLVIFDNDLSPSQIRALEHRIECKIIDRSELILDIFANRATTHAAKLQVEIAQLEYTYPRLRAMWDHLGQIVGGAPVGIGTRGPGEQQLEIDRRLVQRRLRHLRSLLADIQSRKTREVERRTEDHFTVGLVGYTNAGKSTLFNRLTAGGAFAHPKLFATLGTRVERWEMGGGSAVLLSDTVGFIRDLPHHLVASFRSTLEETVYAQLLLLVLDVSDRAAAMQLDTVRATLDEIGATGQPRLLVLNKVDAAEDDDVLAEWREREPDALAVSATTGVGLEALADAVRDQMLGGVRRMVISTGIGESRAISFLETRAAEVIDRSYENGRARFTVRIGRRHLDQLLTQGAAIRIDDDDPAAAIARLWPDPASSAPPDGPPPHERYEDG